MEKKIENTKKVIHMEFDKDDDVEEQLNNAYDVKAKGKVQVKKKTEHYYEFSSEDKEEEQSDQKN